MLAVYFYMGVYPFGDGTLLTIDMTNEYVDYFSAFRDMFARGGSVFYSFSKLLGGSMVGLFAYYLSSPFNIVFFFFGKADFDVAIMVLTLIKIGFCGMAFYFFADKACGRGGLIAVVFSVFYALMAYNIIYQLNIMWLDGVICLPLIALGIQRLIDRGSPKIYFIFLTLAILTNYYIGYMICIFSLLYFIYRLLLSDGYRDAFLKGKYFRRKTGNFIVTSLLSAGASCFLLIPAVITLRTGKEHFTLSNLRFYKDYDFFGILSKLVIGAHSYLDVKHGMPDIFCGLLVTLLVVLFFLNKDISRREKLLSGMFIFIMLLNFYINTLNKVWHGFNPPAWFPFRYSFVFSFLMITLAYRSMLNLHGVRVRHIVATCIVLLGIFGMLASAGYQDVTAKKAAVSALFTAAYSAALVYTLRSHRVNTRLLAVMLLPYVACEFGFNSYEMLADYHYSSKAYYANFVSSVSTAVDSVKNSDTGFYRMEKTFTRLNYNASGNPTVNDPLMFGYNGLSHYSSTDDKSSNRLLGSLGYKNNYNWAYYYRGSTAAANALLGVKYILTDTPYDELYTQVNQVNGYYIYKNANALPLGFMTSSNILKTTLSTKNPFTQINSIYSSMLKSGPGDIMTAEKPQMTLHNLRMVQNGGRTRFVRIDASADASIVYTFSSAAGGADYAFFSTDRFHKVTMKLNDASFGSYFDIYNYGVLPLGKSGSVKTLELDLTQGETDIVSAEFYRLDAAKLSAYTKELTNYPLTITSHTASHITGTATSVGGRRLLFMSLPYDKGWTVRIDGRRVHTREVLGSLTAFYVPPGTHKIEMNYVPQGFAAGIAVTAASLVAAFAYFVALRRRRRLEALRSAEEAE